MPVVRHPGQLPLRRGEGWSWRDCAGTAAHYHTECHHVFLVLAGSGLLRDGSRRCRVEAGMSARAPVN
jgi:mannose-6-phosphate isomerase-like protein (cupin superfamily)